MSLRVLLSPVQLCAGSSVLQVQSAQADPCCWLRMGAAPSHLAQERSSSIPALSPSCSIPPGTPSSSIPADTGWEQLHASSLTPSSSIPALTPSSSIPPGTRWDQLHPSSLSHPAAPSQLSPGTPSPAQQLRGSLHCPGHAVCPS